MLLLGHRDARGDGLDAAQIGQAAVGGGRDNIGDGRQANVGVGAQALLGGAGAAAAAAHQPDGGSRRVTAAWTLATALQLAPGRRRQRLRS